MTCVEFINIIALILGPILAVFVGQFLQNRTKKREDKMALFTTIMASRVYGWTPDSVHALNTVEIIFSDSSSVIDQWKIYYDKLCIQSPDAAELKKIETEHTKLLLEMAKALGYKDKVTWETIQNPYIPAGMVNSINTQNESMRNYAELLRKANGAFSNLSNQGSGGFHDGQAENAQRG